VSAGIVRHYERRGLLSAAAGSVSGYRLYPPEAVARMCVIRIALSIGFSTKGLVEISRERSRGNAPCRRVRGLAAGKLVALETRLRETKLWRRELRSVLLHE
jgi:MerR family copper efflux transcriptional regulator